MVIEISNVKYTKGRSPRLDEITVPGLLAKLNSIIEWDHCLFPPKKKEGTEDEIVEDRDFLGADPELKAGHVFKFGNQLMAIEDENTIVLVLSETGIKGLQRVWNEKISQEFNIAFGGYQPDGAELEIPTNTDIPDTWEEKSISYDIMRLLKDRIIPGRDGEGFKEKGTHINITLHSSIIMYPIHLVLKDWSFWYDPTELEDPEEVKLVEKELVFYLYNKYPRIKVSKEDPYEKENRARKEAKRIADEIIESIENENKA